MEDEQNINPKDTRATEDGTSLSNISSEDTPSTNEDNALLKQIREGRGTLIKPESEGLTEEQTALKGELKELRDKERQEVLSHSIELGRSPVFVIQFEKKVGELFTKEDHERGLQILQSLSEDEDVIGSMHREGDALHLSGVLLTEEGLKKLKDEVEKLKETEIDAKIALAQPQEGDTQTLTVVDDRFTIFSSGVLALARAEKVDIHDFDFDQVNQLAGEQDKVNGKKIISGPKETELLEPQNSDTIQFMKEEERKKLNIPEFVFQVPEANEVRTLELRLEDFMIAIPDLNESGEMLTNEADPERRRIRNVLNYQMFDTIAQNVDYAYQLDEGEEGPIQFVGTTAELGDSWEFILPRNDTAYTTVIGALTIQVPPDEMTEDASGRVPLPRDHGHMSNIEAPLPREGILTLYMVGDKIIGFDRTWDPKIEKQLENAHKGDEENPGLRSSQIMTVDQL